MKISPLLAVFLAIAGCSGGSHSSGASAGWASKWCQAQPGMTKEQLVGIMGAPTSSPPSQMAWSDDHWRFYAFLNEDGTVRQLDINQVDLTPAEKAGLQCTDVRSKQSMQAKAAAAAAAARDNRPACEIIPQARMSEILGSPVTGAPAGHDKCIYKATAAKGPYVEFSFDPGDGAAGMAGAGMAESSQPGLTDPLEGIGDKAVAAGPALFIKSGDDLVTLVAMRVSDYKDVARKIVEATKAPH